MTAAILSIFPQEKICKVCLTAKPLHSFAFCGAPAVKAKYRLKTCRDCQRKKENVRAHKRWHGDTEYRERKRAIQKAAYEKHGKAKYALRKSDPYRFDRVYYVRKKYGLTIDAVNAMLESQHGLCGNLRCGQVISFDAPRNTTQSAVIDHDHNTGRVRGILCHFCNLDLGKIEKNFPRFLGLTEYSQHHQRKDI